MNRRGFFKAVGLGTVAVASGAVTKLLLKQTPLARFRDATTAMGTTGDVFLRLKATTTLTAERFDELRESVAKLPPRPARLHRAKRRL